MERGILETGLGGALQLTKAAPPTLLQNPAQHPREASQPLSQVKIVRSGEGHLVLSLGSSAGWHKPSITHGSEILFHLLPGGSLLSSGEKEVNKQGEPTGKKTEDLEGV